MIKVEKVRGEGRREICLEKDDVQFYIALKPEWLPERDLVGYYQMCGRTMPVTSRGLDGFNWRGGKFDSDKQYCEIGPGFAGYFPKVKTEFEKKPIVIDAAPYDIFYELMCRAEEEVNNLGGFTRDYGLESLALMKKHVEFYLNSDKVRFFNMTLQEAVLKHGLVNILDEEPICEYSVKHWEHAGKGVGDGPSNEELIKMMMKN